MQAALIMVLSFALAAGCAASRPSSYAEAPASDGWAESAEQGRMSLASDEAASPARPQMRGGAPVAAPRPAAPASMPAGGPPGGMGAGVGSADVEDRGEAPASEHAAPRPLLIYTGHLVLAIYDVTAVQQKALAMVEDMGGFVANRTQNQLVLRVPAARFREAMDALGRLGDTLDMGWQSQDVTEQVRDLNIRLENARQLRERLQSLLARAEKIEDALAIEAQLERVTLEIERIIGQLRSMEERIAYSTITVYFQAKSPDQVPADEYLLPYRWLNRLGVEHLLRIPEVGR